MIIQGVLVTLVTLLLGLVGLLVGIIGFVVLLLYRKGIQGDAKDTPVG